MRITAFKGGGKSDVMSRQPVAARLPVRPASLAGNPPSSLRLHRTRLPAALSPAGVHRRRAWMDRANSMSFAFLFSPSFAFTLCSKNIATPAWSPTLAGHDCLQEQKFVAQACGLFAAGQQDACIAVGKVGDQPVDRFRLGILSLPASRFRNYRTTISRSTHAPHSRSLRVADFAQTCPLPRGFITKQGAHQRIPEIYSVHLVRKRIAAHSL